MTTLPVICACCYSAISTVLGYCDDCNETDCSGPPIYGGLAIIYEKDKDEDTDSGYESYDIDEL